ncbi:TnsA-like heteromeric transposase endonuclease subunit [Streptomyces hebeiensis]|uniref:TnsA-like heteromeric transposase endonuclease subunit n=1 Tax=Streptomyces hebeiensis TaxID=229486 RepID=A0ABN1UPK6_9ACTN
MASPDVTLSVRCRDGAVLEDRAWTTVSVDLLRSASPWRTFRWHKGQKHYAGTYWSATTQSHVPYESRLELARLLFADFDPSVHGIVAQPFLLKFAVEGKIRKHVPDYFLSTQRGPVVVDVKPHHRLAQGETAATFAWTRQAVEARGWRYEVWSEPPAELLENIRFLAGFRRGWLFAPGLLDELRRSDLDGAPLEAASQCVPGPPAPCVRAAIHHLLWTHELHADLAELLRPSTVLRRSA